MQVHHGNGTQKIFYDDDRVLFVSLHRRDKDFYPAVSITHNINQRQHDITCAVHSVTALICLPCSYLCHATRSSAHLPPAADHPRSARVA